MHIRKDLQKIVNNRQRISVLSSFETMTGRYFYMAFPAACSLHAGQ